MIRYVSDRLEKKAVILCYHRVVDGKADYYSAPGTQLESRNFRSQLKLWSKKYKIIPLSELVAILKDGYGFNSSYMVLTFDDGFKDGFTHVLPVLKEFAVSGTFFVSANFIGKNSLFWQNQPRYYLSLTTRDRLKWKGIDFPIVSKNDKLRAECILKEKLGLMGPEKREADLYRIRQSLGINNDALSDKEIMLNHNDIYQMQSSPFVEVGSHSMSHSILSNCPPDQIEFEVKEERKIWDSTASIPVVFFAYPFGIYSESAMASLQSNGYEAAVTLREGFVRKSDDLYQLNRISVFRDDTTLSVMIRKLLRLYLRHIFSNIKSFLIWKFKK